MFTLLLTVNVVTRQAFLLAFHTPTGTMVAWSPVHFNEIDWRSSGKIMWDYDPNCNLDMLMCFDDDDTDIYARQVSFGVFRRIQMARSDIGIEWIEAA